MSPAASFAVCLAACSCGREAPEPTGLVEPVDAGVEVRAGCCERECQPDCDPGKCY